MAPKHSHVRKASARDTAVDEIDLLDGEVYDDTMTDDTMDTMPDLLDDSDTNGDDDEDGEDLDDTESDDEAEEDDILSELLVTEDGETIPDVLVGMRGALDQIAVGLNKQNKILFMIAKALSEMSE